MADRLEPYRDLRTILAGVEKPGRYTGGEYGAIHKDPQSRLRIAVSYPDMYEIGMSNLSVRLIYGLLNALPDVVCERVFAPAPDFEAELRRHGIPLYSLESGTPLSLFDVVGFSVGYELTFTNLLNILDLGGIPLRCRERGDGDPIVVAGGPAVTNPVPFGAFVDAVFIGEIEGEGIDALTEIAAMKRRGARRGDLLEQLAGKPFVWHAGKSAPVRRVLWRGFGGPAGGGPGASSQSAQPQVPFPVPSLRTVQDHGVVEIMRGCPNGCRFCHAGIFYRPFRLKDPEAVVREVEAQVRACGYREVTLSSLSTGDYPGIEELVRFLNTRYQADRVSFSLPSLRINSVALTLLSEISAVRKSGLTFAVETPLEEWQRGINKLAPLQRTAEVLREARERGWRLAKFYFMLGLPSSQGEEEVEPILEFLAALKRQSSLALNVNVSSFIPKPHTPFQWAAQLGEEAALERLTALKRGLSRMGINAHYHSPFLSLLEGMISRGDERAGELVYRGFRAGARFDSWEELVQWELWRRLFEEADWEVERETCRARDLEEQLPWSCVSLGVTDAFLKREYGKALRGELTSACAADCSHHCGVCAGDTAVRTLGGGGASREELEARLAEGEAAVPAGEHRPLLFAFSKTGSAAFLAHLDVVQILERALVRAGYRAAFSEGFNPKPRLEVAQPLSLGIEAEEEIAQVELQNLDGEESFLERVGQALPEGFRVVRARALPPWRPGEKKHSLMSLYAGAEYRVSHESPEELARVRRALSEDRRGLDVRLTPVSGDHQSIVLRLEQREKVSANVLRLLESAGIERPLQCGFSVIRTQLLARTDSNEPAASYFELELLSG
jgi:radical SAM-linked protein